MKTSCKKLQALTVILLASLASAVQADVVLGSWQSSTAEGWVNPGNGLLITDPANTTIYSFGPNGVPGYTQSLQINQAGFGGALQLNLSAVGALTAFNNNHLLSFIFGVPANPATAGYSQMYALNINAPGYGYHNVGDGGNKPATWGTSAFSVQNVSGANQNDGGEPNYYWFTGAGTSVRAEMVTFDYTSILPAIIAGGEGYVQITFTFNDGGGAPSTLLMNNVVLSGGPVPEPCSMALIGLGMAALLIRRRSH